MREREEIGFKMEKIERLGVAPEIFSGDQIMGVSKLLEQPLTSLGKAQLDPGRQALKTSVTIHSTALYFIDVLWALCFRRDDESYKGPS